MIYTCPACGTGRWHCVNCREAPTEARGAMYDEAERQPVLAVETTALLAAANQSLAAVRNSAERDTP